ncbi:hypothetical protein HMPREF1141_1769 [Clostridium sp. MSTE9]|jgi:hypothetical protein|nr:hypothetical protein HMPREF1141_1769 [Clostridium sp. MSTE9]
MLCASRNPAVWPQRKNSFLYVKINQKHKATKKQVRFGTRGKPYARRISVRGHPQNEFTLSKQTIKKVGFPQYEKQAENMLSHL